MKHAKAAVVVDSFMSHLAGAVGTNVVVLYGPAPARVVQPRMQHGAKLINLEPDMLKVCPVLSHCWSNPPRGKVKCQSPCINTISPIDVQKALGKLLDFHVYDDGVPTSYSITKPDGESLEDNLRE